MPQKASSVLLFALLIGVSSRFLSEPKDVEVSIAKYRDGEEDIDGVGGMFGEAPKLGNFPEEQELGETTEEQPPTQQEKPKLQPNDESAVVADVDQQVEDPHDDPETKQTEKTVESRTDCVPRELVEDKAYRASEESVAKEVIEDSLSPVEERVETSTFSMVTDPDMIEEPFKKVYFRPLCPE